MLFLDFFLGIDINPAPNSKLSLLPTSLICLTLLHYICRGNIPPDLILGGSPPEISCPSWRSRPRHWDKVRTKNWERVKGFGIRAGESENEGRGRVRGRP